LVNVQIIIYEFSKEKKTRDKRWNRRFEGKRDVKTKIAAETAESTQNSEEEMCT